jgi:hypothetical protein|tara:strand:- start:201 stop:341 length:141 start_codon:yes stop_codon:yes gene_type:complete
MDRYVAEVRKGLGDDTQEVYLYAYSKDHVTQILKDYFIVELRRVYA